MTNIFKEYEQLTGLHAKGAAKALGVPLSTWRKWVQGVRKPRSSAVRLVTMAVDRARTIERVKNESVPQDPSIEELIASIEAAAAGRGVS